MKSIKLNNALPYMMMLLFSFIGLTLHAQDNPGGNTGNSGGSTKITTETTTTTTDWYAQPWVWIVGAAVLIIVLVALLRGNNTDSREVTRTTVIKDDRP